MSKKYVYLFTEGNGSMRELLGGKGANLAEMRLALLFAATSVKRMPDAAFDGFFAAFNDFG